MPNDSRVEGELAEEDMHCERPGAITTAREAAARALAFGTAALDVSRGRTPRHQRIAAPSDGALQVRQFLWDEIGLKGLYRGDGLTYDDDGQPGNREFLARQMPLSAIEGAVVVDVVPSRG